MTVYNFNLLIGFEKGGVEHAQALRAKLFDSMGEENKFIFTQFPTPYELEFYINLGFHKDNLELFYQRFTDNHSIVPELTIDEVLEEMCLSSAKSDIVEEDYCYILSIEETLVIFNKFQKSNIIYQVDFYRHHYLLKKEYFSNKKIMTEYFTPVNNQAQLYRRIFYNRDASIGLEEHIFEDKHIFSSRDIYAVDQNILFEYYIKKLEFTRDDLIILDRTTYFDFAQIIYEQKKEAKLGVFIHSEHYYNGLGDFKLMNPEYYYIYQNVESTDFYITSTQLQADLLAKSIEVQVGKVPNVKVIPAAALKNSEKRETRLNHCLITASRLTEYKKIDWIIKAVVQAKKTISDLTLDIYGQGYKENEYRELIDYYQANDYIKLKGYRNLATVYPKYSVYITASVTETLGLTYLEAMQSSLAMIGLDVHYGAATLIENEVNGYLVPFDELEAESIVVDNLSKAIVKIYQAKNLANMQEQSYSKSQHYREEVIAEKWHNLIEEMRG